MKFTPKLADLIIKKFNQVAPSAKCSLCDSTEFNLINGFATLHLNEDQPAASVLKFDKTTPNAVMVCTRCGNTYLLNLLILGIIEPGI